MKIKWKQEKILELFAKMGEYGCALQRKAYWQDPFKPVLLTLTTGVDHIANVHRKYFE